GPAGPGSATPGAQCPGTVEARLALLAGLDAAAARDAELGLRAVCAGPAPLAGDGASLVALEGEGLVLSALKPAERGDGLVVRVLNPTDAGAEATLRLGFAVADAESLRLDETPDGGVLTRDGATLRLPVPAHGLRTVALR
ncbi:MAG TPA: glycosyl hydrolase-related protein, partial [Myxococcota bacterium]|nr:glycosyl hydrolase-related protein [Myxococcota bacterium]